MVVAFSRLCKFRKNKKGYQVCRRAIENYGDDIVKGFCLGNAFKYLYRLKQCVKRLRALLRGGIGRRTFYAVIVKWLQDTH